MTDHLDQVEALNALANLAQLSRGFYQALRKEGFNSKESLALTTTWLDGSRSESGRRRVISCTQAACREPARVGLRWVESPMAGWTMTNERCFCNEHGDDAVAQLKQRGISVTYTDFGMPVI